MQICQVLLFGKCVGDPVALAILGLLRHGDLKLCQIQSALNLSRSSVDLRLGRLRRAGVVEQYRDGHQWVFSISSGFLGLVNAVFASFEDALDWDADLYARAKSA